MESFSDVSTIERKSSIETEPRTLNCNQIKYAREAALYVVENKSSEEAWTIFTEGLIIPCKTVERKRKKDRNGSSGGESGSEEYQLLAAPDSIHLRRDTASSPF